MSTTGHPWWDYVHDIAGDASQAAIARRAGLSPATVSRWVKSDPNPRNVAAFAVQYGRPVLEAFVAAGFLTEEQARTQVVRADPHALTNDELLDEVRARMRGDHPQGDPPPADDDPRVVAMRAAGMSDKAIRQTLER